MTTATKRYEVVSHHYDKATRKDVRVVHGIVEAGEVNEAHAKAVVQYGVGKYDFDRKRSVQVKEIV
jgi:hypothetical protein